MLLEGSGGRPLPPGAARGVSAGASGPPGLRCSLQPPQARACPQCPQGTPGGRTPRDSALTARDTSFLPSVTQEQVRR